MTHTLTSSITRREYLSGLLSLSAASFSGSTFRTAAQETPTQRSSYSAPELRCGEDIEYLRDAPSCKATRYSEGVPPTCTSKIFVESDGTLHLKTLSFLDRSGWMDRWRTRTRVEMPTIRNPTYSDPDIHPSHGSGVLLTVGTGVTQREMYLSNEHVFRGEAWQIEEKAVYDWHYDVGVMSAKEIRGNRGDRTQPPRGRLADTSVRNANLCSRSVEVVGFGSDLFKFVGTPFRLPYVITPSVPFVESPPRQHLLFGLKIPRAFLRDIAEIGGMSGSPVVLQGTKEVVGTVSRILEFMDGTNPIRVLLFTGPDEVRGIMSHAERVLGL